MGLLRRAELGAVLLEFMHRIGETRLKGILAQLCPEIDWEAAKGAMDLALKAGLEFLEAPTVGIGSIHPPIPG